MYTFLKLVSIYTIIKTCTKHDDIGLEVLDFTLQFMKKSLINEYSDSVDHVDELTTNI